VVVEVLIFLVALDDERAISGFATVVKLFSCVAEEVILVVLADSVFVCVIQDRMSLVLVSAFGSVVKVGLLVVVIVVVSVYV
jgi:hypothetical protein